MTLLHHIKLWFLKTISSHKYQERRIEVYDTFIGYDMTFFISHAI